jgi:hypothetical protein
MSIQATLNAYIGNRLFVLEPSIRSDETPRVVIVSQEVRDAVDGDLPENWDGMRLADFRQTLDAFTTGEEITVAENPFRKPSDCFMARVSPVECEVFDIRSLFGPGIRAFGFFVGLNQFLVLTWDYRENIDSFEYECKRCVSEWKQMFGSLDPFSKGKELHEYITEIVPV